MIIQLILMTVATTCSTALVSPFDKGVMGKVSKQFLQDFADEVADLTSTLLGGGGGHVLTLFKIALTY